MADVIEYGGKKYKYMCDTADRGGIILRELPDEPDERERVMAELAQAWCGGSITVDEARKNLANKYVRAGYECLVDYIEANYVPKAEANRRRDEQYNCGYKNGRDWGRQEAKQAAKPRIKPEDLDTVANGLRLAEHEKHAPIYTGWDESSGAVQDCYRKDALSMLNAEVAVTQEVKTVEVKRRIPSTVLDILVRLFCDEQHGHGHYEKHGINGKKDHQRTLLELLNAEVADDVDFVVSGAVGENLAGLTEKARASYGCSWGSMITTWSDQDCGTRRDTLASLYTWGDRILLDKEGGGHERK
jgi:hypothetical protein